MEGYADFKPSPSDAGRSMVIGKSGLEVDRGEIPSYFTPENMQAIGLWTRYRLLGWPYTGGWMEQPARLVDIIATLEMEQRKRENAS